MPSNVCVTTDLDARAGDLRIAGDDSDGVDVHSQANAGSTATPRLDLTGEVDLGELRVINDDDADLDGRDHFRFGDDREPRRDGRGVDRGVQRRPRRRRRRRRSTGGGQVGRRRRPQARAATAGAKPE